MTGKKYLDIAWFVLLGVFLFGAGIAYQWYVNRNPVHPLTVPGQVLDVSKNQVADMLHLVGLKKPGYYYQRDHGDSGTFYDPATAQPGLTLITSATSEHRLEARIIALDGSPVQVWPIDWFELWPDADHVPETLRPKQQPGTHIHGAVIMENGDLVFNFEFQGMLRLDVCGDVVWRLPYLTHHSLHRDPRTGNFWSSGRIFHEKPSPRFPNHVPTFAEPTVVEVTPDGEILTEISILELLEKNDLDGLLYMDDFDDIQRDRARTTGDTLHLNDVEVFPPDLSSDVFDPGDLMVSLRNIHTILVFDPETEEIVYQQSGGFVGQHDPDFIGGDRISVFDNAATFDEEAQQSRVIIFDAAAAVAEPDVYFEGSDDKPFYTRVMGKHQWLDNGNLLLTEATGGRAFEIDRDGDIVWQHLNVVDDGWVGLIDEAQRLPVSFDEAFFEEQRRERCQGNQRIARRDDRTS
ncbi:MAG: arylsulfotransferase family protein [Pseudomonadota bacterium]